MNVPMSWLKEYVDIDCNLETFIDAVTMSGSKVENVEMLAHNITNVVVGRIEAIAKHSDADKLVVCQVNIGEAENTQIVTAATNVFEGAYVPAALPGANLSGGLQIKKGKLRGVESFGMFCSVEELGFTRNDYPEAPEDGIYIFEGEPTLGADVLALLGMRDEVVEYEITSDRVDCFSVLGIAREVAATFDKPFKQPEITIEEKAAGTASDFISVEIENENLCPRYVARVVKNVKIGPSPQWLRHRLTACGIRPINNIVDITNYVMLEFGQPMHAFNASNITGEKIIVRNAKDGEKFTTLDGTERTLDSSMLVISDPQKAVAIAGVMGGENSMIEGDSDAVLFESATFNGPNVRATSKKLGLRTDSSVKFAKGLDPNLAEVAINRAMQLVEMLGCGEVVPANVDCYPKKREGYALPFEPAKINKLLGTNIPEADMVAYLERIGIVLDGNSLKIPTFRADIEGWADIAQEVARLYGYEKIESTLAAGASTVGKKTYNQTIEDIIRQTCFAQGVDEALTFSFESPKVFDKLNLPTDSVLRNTVTIVNPLGEDYSIMKTTSLNGILEALSLNYNRRNAEAALFEVSKIYVPKSIPLTEQPNERLTLTIGAYGDVDFYSIKGIVQEILAKLNLESKTRFACENNLAFMHPGRTAAIEIGDQNAGFVGEVHPFVLENYEIGTKAYVAMLDIEILAANANLLSEYKPLPKYPSIARDIAIVVSENITVAEIEDAICERGGKLLEGIKLFDVYQGEQIEAGKKSVAYSCYFRATDRTLTDDEVGAVMKKIYRNLEEKLDAQLR